MILQRVTAHLKRQDWTAIALDLLIVIVGVFIGMQVSNWNEARSERARERNYLERLRFDFTANVKTLESYVEARRREGQTLADLTFALRQERKAPTNDALQGPLCRWGATALPDLRQGTYDELVSSGALSLLRDQELRILLADYSASEERSAYVGTLLPALQHAAAPLDSHRVWMVTGESSAKFNGAVRCQFDIAGMRRDPRMPSVIAQLARYQKLHEMFRSGELDKARAVEARLNELVGSRR
jgi:hypothetical protein